MNLTNDRIQIRISLGPRVQTLTRAFAGILTQGLDGAPREAVLNVSADAFTCITGLLSPKRSASLSYLINRITESVGQLTL